MTVEKEPCKSKDMMPSQKGTLHIGADVKGELVVHLTWAIVAPSLESGSMSFVSSDQNLNSVQHSETALMSDLCPSPAEATFIP